MQTRDVADRILFSPSIEDKLAAIPPGVIDDDPGPIERVAEPSRSRDLQFAPRRAAPAMPSASVMADPAKRALAHHIMANHELQALEIMAFVLRAFPDADADFRQGLLPIMADEQRHTRMHMERAASLGVRFGDYPVNSYFWNKAQQFQTLLDYLAGLPLTFEGRNLDHTLEFTEHFERAGDLRSAAVMRQIHTDEIQHVAFGLEWFRRLKPASQSDWDAYESCLHWPLRPSKSIGNRFHAAPRRAAGMENDFISRLQAANGAEDG
ncbi:MAG: DUF455 family protein [Planctomycetaceae bacterium]